MSQPKEIPQMEKIVSLCKRRGFIFQSSEIYGGINGFWDYGPLGAELKRNLRDTWWRAMTREREDVVGLDATIIMHPAIWKASGHVDTFSDPMSDCLVTKKRFRSDHVEPQVGTAYHWAGARKSYTEAAKEWVIDQVAKALQNATGQLEFNPTPYLTQLHEMAGSVEGLKALRVCGKVAQVQLRTRERRWGKSWISIYPPT